jgi:hypothetical protein
MSRISKIFNKKWLSGEGSQEKLLKDIKNDQRLLKCVVDNRHSWRIFEQNEIIDTISNHNGFICEILSNFPQKVYFDIDCKEIEKLNLNDVKNIIKKYFPDGELSISGSETDFKKSYHIIVNNYIISNINDRDKMKQLVKYIVDNECEFFDWKVYTTNRAMKCVFQSKPDREKQMIIEDQEIKNHLICSFIKEDSKKLKDKYIEIDHKTEFLNINKVDEFKTTLKLPQEFKNEDILDAQKLLKMMPCSPTTSYDLTYKMMLFSINNGLSFDDWWAWKLQKSDKDIKKYRYEWDNTIKNHTDYIFTRSTMMKLLTLIYPDLVNVENEIDLITNQFIKTLSIEQKNINRIEKDHFLVPNKTIIFNIGMGGGKTTMTVDFLKTSNKSFVWLAPRQALVMNTYQRFTQNKMNVLNYLKCGTSRAVKHKKINEARNLIVCCESLNYLEDTSKYDVVVIDEIESVLNTWDSETHTKNIVKNFKNFCDLLINSKKIILLDAFTTQKTINFLKSLNIHDNIIYGSSYKPEKKTLIFNDDYESTIDKMAQELDDNKKLYVFHAYKSSTLKHYSIEELKSKLLEKCDTKPRILVYHGDMDDSQKKSLYDVNIEWDKYDCILTTSSITVGVNYEGDKFDKVYLMVSGCVNNVRDVIQTSMRIRKTKEKNIEMFFFDRMEKMTLKRPLYYQEKNLIYNQLIDDIFIEKQSSFIEIFCRFCELTNYDYGDLLTKKEKVKINKFENELFESKILIPYEDLEIIYEDECKDLERKVWAYESTMRDKFLIKKHYFDIKFWDLSETEKTFIWNNRIEQYFNNQNSKIIKMICKDNEINDLKSINFDKLIVSEDTSNYIKNNYSQINIKLQVQKIVKVINYELGGEMIEVIRNKKNCHYEFSDLFQTCAKINRNLNPIIENGFISD